MALGFMRRHRRWLYVFLWLVILTFVIFFGIPMDEIAGTEGVGATVAEVGDARITAAEYSRAYNALRRDYQRLYQGRIDDEMLRRMGLEEQALQRLINEHVLTQEAERLGLSVDDESLKAYIQGQPDFQVNGRFIGGPELRRIMERQGLTVEQFEREMRRSLLREKLENLVTDGVTVTDAEVEAEHRRRNEKVKVEYVLAPADPTTVAVTEEEVRAHFEKSKQDYRLPERRVLSYLLLDPAAVQARITLTDRDKRSYYEAHKDEFRTEDEACAAHVLVKVKSEEQPEGHPEAEARALAEKALAEIRAGKDFAEVARRVSEDEGSAPRGGDLGCFGRGQMVAEFDEAAFSLPPGQASDLVRTPYGFHVIRVGTRRAASVQDYESVRQRIEQTLLAQRGRDLLGEMAARVGDAVARGRSLEDAAREEGLAVQKTAPLARGDVKPPLASPTLMARAFELTRGQTAPEPLPVGGGIAFVRVDEVQAPRMPDFTEVKEAVQAALKRERAFERARGLAADPAALAAERAMIRASLEQQRKDQLFRAYLQEARKRFRVERHDDVMRRLVG